VRRHADCDAGHGAAGPGRHQGMDRRRRGPQARERGARLLAQLPRGEGWVWYPEGGHIERVYFPKIKTYDSSATPAHGAKAGPKVAEIDLGEVQKAMAEAVKEAEANDPKLLRKRIADLEREAKAKPGATTVVDQAAIDRVCAARDREWQKLIKEREAIIGQLKGRMGKAAELLHVNGEAVATSPALLLKSATESIPSPIPRAQKTAVSSAVSVKHSPSVGSQPSGDLRPYHLDLVRVLVSRHPVPTPRAQLAALAHKSTKSSAFNPALRDVISAGLAVESGRGYLATDDAMSQYGDERTAPISGPEALEYWLRSLPDYEAGLLRVLANSGDWMTPEEIAAISGKSITSSAFKPALRNLEQLEFVAKEGGRYVIGELFS
jgi:hypothetical protein